MNLKDLIEVGSTRLTSAFNEGYATLVRPAIHYAPSQTNTQDDGPLSLNAGFWSYVILAVFIGSTLQSLPPLGRPVTLLTTVVTVLAVWMTYAAFVHVVMRVVFRTVEEFRKTAVVTLKVIGVAYVVASGGALILAFFASALPRRFPMTGPITYLVLHALVLGICGTAALSSVHRLGRGQRVVLFFAILVPPLAFNAIALLRSGSEIGPK